jgi:uncharacterized protein
MRLVYSADLHGDLASYEAFLDLAVKQDARAAIVGGDLLPHAIRLEGALEIQRAFIHERLRPLLERFHAAHPTIGIYLLPGNDDWAAAIAALDELEHDRLFFPLHERVYELGSGLRIAGYGCVPLTPFSIKDYERRDMGPLPASDFGMAYVSWEGAIRPVGAGELADLPSIAEAMAELARQSDPGRTIYVCHTPPADTSLDQMPRNRHVGSQAVRQFIAKHTPPLTLHGHIHEAPQLSGQYAIRLGSTWSVNPGHDQRRFGAVALDTHDIEGTIEHTIFGRPAW